MTTIRKRWFPVIVVWSLDAGSDPPCSMGSGSIFLIQKQTASNYIGMLLVLIH